MCIELETTVDSPLKSYDERARNREASLSLSLCVYERCIALHCIIYSVRIFIFRAQH